MFVYNYVCFLAEKCIIQKKSRGSKKWEKVENSTKRSLLKCMPWVPCVPEWSTCPRANVPKVCQYVIFTCQRANKRANVLKPFQFFNLACQRVRDVPIIQFGVPTIQKASQYFSYFSKENIFSILKFFNYG